MRLAIDVMGFENDIGQATKACDIFCTNHQDVEITLVGDQELIKKCLPSEHNYKIFHTTQVVMMDDNPLTVVRAKTDSSMYRTIELAKLDKVDGALSAGSTNCFIAMAYILLGLIPGVNKPGFLVSIPTTIRNKNTLMIDVGASKTCTGDDLYQFALMANVYAKKTLNIPNPTIAILNIGTEKTKGLDYHRQTYDLLEKDKSLKFHGFIEPRNILDGVVDIVVCDGYSGNLTLKSLEAGLKSISTVLKREFKKPLN
jgi:glycerol-3-phosphate acyltransferase PlsX